MQSFDLFLIGLEGGFTGKPGIFTVDMKGAGKGGLGLGIEGPVEAKMNCRDNRDGTCEVEYLPTKPGVYDIAVTFDNKPIPGIYILKAIFQNECDVLMV